MWVGKEMEGKYMGLQTLFIQGGTHKFKDIQPFVADERPCVKQLYFGAGGCSSIDWNTVKECYKRFTDLIVIAEVKLIHLHKVPEIILDEGICELIITFKTRDIQHIKMDKLDKYQLKIQNLMGKNKLLMIAKCEDFIKTDIEQLEKYKYKDDKVVA